MSKTTFGCGIIASYFQKEKNCMISLSPRKRHPLLRKTFQMVTATPLYVWRYTGLSNYLCLLALRHKAIPVFALTLTPALSACVLRGRGALMRQDYENQSPSPSQKAEAWLSAYRPVLIRLTHCDTGRVWYTTKDRAWTHCDSHTWPWPAESVNVHQFCYLWCRAGAVGRQFCQCSSLVAQWMTWHRSCGHSLP